MKIVLLAVGKTSTDYLIKGIEGFIKRINHYVPMELSIIPDLKSTKGLTEETQKVREGQAMIAALQSGDVVVLLDERGKEYTSREFASQIDRKMVQGIKRLVFVIGGPYGFSQEMYDRANEKISLSRMTFTHEMVRLFFVEQIYRAMTLLPREPYHHD